MYRNGTWASQTFGVSAMGSNRLYESLTYEEGNHSSRGDALGQGDVIR